MRCTNCGMRNKSEARFCKRCGAPLQSSGGGPKRRWVLVAAVSAAVTVAVVTVAVLIGSKACARGALDYDSVLRTMQQANGGELPEITADENGAVRFVRGHFTNRTVQGEGDALAAIADVAPVLGLKNAGQELQFQRRDEHEGISFYRFQQLWGNIPVYGRQLVLSVDNSGEVASLSGEITRIDDLSSQPVVSEDEALQVADSEEELSPLYCEGLVVCVTDSGSELAWKIVCADTHCFVSARSGEVLSTVPLSYADEGIDGVHDNDHAVKFNTERNDDGTYSLVDSKRNITYHDVDGENLLGGQSIIDLNGNELFFYDASVKRTYSSGRSNQVDYPTFDVADDCSLCRINDSGERYQIVAAGYSRKSKDGISVCSDADNRWDDEYLLNVVSGVNSAYDYYETNGWKGLCGHNHPLKIYCRDALDGESTNAAAHFGYGCIRIGSKSDCDEETLAHEYTHLVVQGISSLESSGKSSQQAALHEAYSDILALVINDDSSWSLSNGLRDLIHPEKSTEGIGSKHLSVFSEDSLADDEHYNATIVGHAAYLMFNKGLTMGEVGRIWFGSLFYLSPTADFSTCRSAVIAAAYAAGLSENKIQIVRDSFAEVGIRDAAPLLSSATIYAFNADGTAHNGFELTLQSVDEANRGDVFSLYTTGPSVTLSDIEGTLPKAMYLMTVKDTKNPEVKWTQYVVVSNEGGVSRLDVNLGTETESNRGDQELLEKFARDLDIQRYEVDYLWQARGFNHDPWMQLVVGNGIPDGSAVGSRIADFDGDGANELLVVRWKSASIWLEMYEVRYGNAVMQADVSDYSFNFPHTGSTCGVGCLDVACDEQNGICIQWFNSAYIGDYQEWELDRYTYDGESFRNKGKAEQVGTDVYDLSELKRQLDSLGVPNGSIPEANADGSALVSMLSDSEDSLHLVTRVIAGSNPSPVNHDALNSVGFLNTDQWSVPERMGAFIITQSNEQGNFSSGTSEQEAPSSAFVLSGRVRVHEEFHYSLNRSVTVVSMTLDNPIPYTYEYKGTVEAEAHEVLLETSLDDSFGTWSGYDGRHITVGCDDLRGAYHDASYFAVDTMAMGNIRLLSTDRS